MRMRMRMRMRMSGGGMFVVDRGDAVDSLSFLVFTLCFVVWRL